MASRAGAFALVIGGSVIAYSAFTKRSVIDTILMRPSPGSISNDGGSPNTQTVAVAGNAYTGGGIRAQVLQYAEQSINSPSGTYEYDENRPYPRNLFGPPTPVKTDCSGWVTLVYKAAGAKDPNNQIGRAHV